MGSQGGWIGIKRRMDGREEEKGYRIIKQEKENLRITSRASGYRFKSHERRGV